MPQINPVEAEECLQNMVYVVDSLEQHTEALDIRLSYLQPFVRERLLSGDYTAKTLLPNGTWFYLPVSIERKMSLSEAAGNFCRERERFRAEFNRARDAEIRLYILIEQSSWENAYAGAYRSQMKPQSLIASLLTWMARYGCPILLCDVSADDKEAQEEKNKRTAMLSGKLIRDILKYEMREALERMVDDG